MQKTVISGVLLLDKPADISSHTALFRAKHLFKSDSQDSKKAGHTGTLDPMATGLLPLCFGEATKFAQYGLDANKGYIATIRLGEQTDTGDMQGVVIATAAVPAIDQTMLDELSLAMIGEQWQTPPMYSALKKDGKKLYEYAREGIQLQREPRRIVIHQLQLRRIDERTLALSVLCSKGSYVRVLAEDIAGRLGTLGHLIGLRRTQTGGFMLAEAVDFAALEEMDMPKRLLQLLPADVLVAHLPILTVDADESQRLKIGQRLNVAKRAAALFTEQAEPSCMVRLYADGAFVGLGELAITGRLQPKKMLA